MSEIKVVIGDKSGKSYQKVVENSDVLVGRKLGESIKGDLIGLSGYEFTITGGSDYCGFPMRKEIKGSRRARILAHSGVGIKVKDKGIFIRKTVAGDTIWDKTNQVNLKVVKEGSKKLDEIFTKKESEPEKKEGDKPNVKKN